MKSEWEITTETTEPKLNKPVFIEGLPGIGNVGKIAVDFLIEEFKAKKLYTFFSHKFPHSVFVNEENLVETPKLEIYYKTFKGKPDLLLLTGDIQPIDEESCYSFCEEIIKIAKKYACTEIVTTGGIGLQQVPEKPKVYCTANDKELFQQYIKKGMLVEKNIFGVVGPIVGVSGVLLGLGKRRGVKGVSLLAETFGHPMFLGIKGAKELLRVIEKKFNYGLDLKKMSKEIVQVEKELMKKTKEWLSEDKSTPAGAQAKKKDMSYIG
ncbi:MAG: PAC2 family protein [Nanoarchaeota archaeon]|nr:PAC2 family protein [Nanoarchaeota archaeon]MBU1622530.1 PAC2 family protein [Nanoarchaeota archaeon]MBU1974290.1 PAC2 family protein [Nanoarchaeota archaeon]